MHRCNNCLSQASVDMSSKTPGGSAQKFCSEACRNVFFSDTTKEVAFFDPASLSQPHILLISFDVLLPCSKGGNTRADISVYLSNDPESQLFPNRSLYVVYHHTALLEQQFLEYFINSDGSFSRMVPYYQANEYPEMKYAIDFTRLVLTEKLQELGMEDLKELTEFVAAN